MTRSTYVVAIGSNRRGRHGRPEAEVRAALALLKPAAASPIVASAPIGPSIRRFANAVALVEAEAGPDELLRWLKRIESAFGRRRGRRWGARVIDLDIILWSGGVWRKPGLTIPHPAFRERAFVLVPLALLAPEWRDPVTGLSIRMLLTRLTRARPLPNPRSRREGP